MKYFVIDLYYWIKKYIYCSWKHKGYRCYPVCFKDQIERGANIKYWHCFKCYSCSTEFDRIFKNIKK